MKYLIILILFGSLTFGSCTKPAIESAKIFPKSITGKWRYSQAFYSIGGPLIFKSTENLNQWILFNTDNSFSSNVTAFKDFNKFRIEDSIKLKFFSTSQPVRTYFYRIDSLKNSLSLSSADFICIEGCGDIFKR